MKFQTGFYAVQRNIAAGRYKKKPNSYYYGNNKPSLEPKGLNGKGMAPGDWDVE